MDRQEKENITVEQYLRICEQTGETPDLEKMPVTQDRFPLEVQQANFIFSVLPDQWDGMSGSYLGKDWSALEPLLNIYEIEDKRTVTYFVKVIESRRMMSINNELKRKQEARSRSSKK